VSVTLVATAGNESANAYATVLAADGDGGENEGYLEGRLDTDVWESLTTDQKSRALIRATSIIDSQRLYGTVHLDSDSDLHFPTDQCEDDDGALYIPTPVQQACIELALTLVDVETQAKQYASLKAGGVQSMSEGALSLSFAKTNAADAENLAWKACTEAKRLLRLETSENDYQGWLVKRAHRVTTL